MGREIADAADRPVVVAASVGPTGEISTRGQLVAWTVEIFLDQAIGLKEGGADVLWLETISSPEEYRAAAEAFSHVDLPWVGTMSFDTAGRTMMGVTSRDMVALVAACESTCRLWCKLRNGRVGFVAHGQGFANEAPAQAIVAKGNAGIPKYVDGHICHNGTPELMADYANGVGQWCENHRRVLWHHAQLFERNARGAAPRRRTSLKISPAGGRRVEVALVMACGTTIFSATRDCRSRCRAVANPIFRADWSARAINKSDRSLATRSANPNRFIAT